MARLRRLVAASDSLRLRDLMQMSHTILKHAQCTQPHKQRIADLLRADVTSGSKLGRALRSNKHNAGSTCLRYGKHERALIAQFLDAIPDFTGLDISKEGVQRGVVSICLDLVESNAHIVGVTGLHHEEAEHDSQTTSAVLSDSEDSKPFAARPEPAVSSRHQAPVAEVRGSPLQRGPIPAALDEPDLRAEAQGTADVDMHGTIPSDRGQRRVWGADGDENSARNWQDSNVLYSHHRSRMFGEQMRPVEFSAQSAPALRPLVGGWPRNSCNARLAGANVKVEPEEDGWPPGLDRVASTAARSASGPDGYRASTLQPIQPLPGSFRSPTPHGPGSFSRADAERLYSPNGLCPLPLGSPWYQSELLDMSYPFACGQADLQAQPRGFPPRLCPPSPRALLPPRQAARELRDGRSLRALPASNLAAASRQSEEVGGSDENAGDLAMLKPSAPARNQGLFSHSGSRKGQQHTQEAAATENMNYANMWA